MLQRKPRQSVQEKLHDIDLNNLDIHSNGELDLSGIPLNNERETTKLFNWCKEFPNKLFVLKLNDCEICAPFDPTNHLGMAAVMQIANNVNQIRGILTLEEHKWQTLEFSNNNLGDESVSTILKAIGKNNVLRNLNLSQNVIGDSAAQELSRYLTNKNNVLKYLNLSSCFITENQTKALVTILKSLETNCSLREIDLTGNVLNNVVGKALLEFANKNKMIVEIKYDIQQLNSINTALHGLIQAQLSNHREARQKLHDKLLSEECLLRESEEAIEKDDGDWLTILLGCGISLPEAEEKYQETMAPLQETKILYQLHLDAIDAQTGVLKKYSDKHLNSPIIRQRIQKELDAANAEVHKQTLETLSCQSDVEEIEAKIITPVLERFSVDVKQTESIQRLYLQLKTKERYYEQDIEQLKGRIKTIQAAFTGFQEKHSEIVQLTYQSKLEVKLPTTYLAEFEEISEELINKNASYNSKDISDETLLHRALVGNKPNCLDVLLDLGADPLIKNKSNESAFTLAIREPQNETNKQIIIYCTEGTIGKLWPHSHQLHMPDETQHLQNIKEEIDSYIKNVLSRNYSMSKLARLVLGEWHVVERAKEAEEYYCRLQEASSFKDLQGELKIMAMQSKSAKRGLLGRSRLHSKVQKQLDRFRIPLDHDVRLNAATEEAKHNINATLVHLGLRSPGREKPQTDERKRDEEKRGTDRDELVKEVAELKYTMASVVQQLGPQHPTADTQEGQGSVAIPMTTLLQNSILTSAQQQQEAPVNEGKEEDMSPPSSPRTR